MLKTFLEKRVFDLFKTILTVLTIFESSSDFCVMIFCTGIIIMFLLIQSTGFLPQMLLSYLTFSQSQVMSSQVDQERLFRDVVVF